MTRLAPPTYRVAAGIVRPILRLAMRRDWRGSEHLPAEGGFIATANHLTNLDGLVFAHYLYDHGAPARFLAKHSLFSVPVLGWLLRKAGQIPVHRDTATAGQALDPARRLLQEGQVVAIFPEGTFTRDPDLWPMTARLGVARLALSMRVPVIPVAQWGAQEILPRYGKTVHLFPRRTVRIQAGPPVDLDDLYARAADPAAQREATERIMVAITTMLVQMRGQQPPARPYDTRRDGDPRAEELAAKAARRRARRGRRHQSGKHD